MSSVAGSNLVPSSMVPHSLNPVTIGLIPIFESIRPRSPSNTSPSLELLPSLDLNGTLPDLCRDTYGVQFTDNRTWRHTGVHLVDNDVVWSDVSCLAARPASVFFSSENTSKEFMSV